MTNHNKSLVASHCTRKVQILEVLENSVLTEECFHDRVRIELYMEEQEEEKRKREMVGKNLSGLVYL